MSCFSLAGKLNPLHKQAPTDGRLIKRRTFRRLVAISYAGQQKTARTIRTVHHQHPCDLSIFGILHNI